MTKFYATHTHIIDPNTPNHLWCYTRGFLCLVQGVYASTEKYAESTKELQDKIKKSFEKKQHADKTLHALIKKRHASLRSEAESLRFASVSYNLYRLRWDELENAYSEYGTSFGDHTAKGEQSQHHKKSIHTKQMMYYRSFVEVYFATSKNNLRRQLNARL